MAICHTVRDNIFVVTIDNPPVNALSHTERAGLIAAVEAAEAAGAEAIVLVGANGSFIAGADVREFGLPPEPPYLPEVVDRIESASIPVIAAIEGQALGGGLEIALGCHFRIAAPNAKLGLPEVTLGLVPGAGGTQRLPRLIAPYLAATMISTGKPVSAAEALEAGLVDRIVDGDINAAVFALGEAVRGTVPADRRISTRAAQTSPEALAALDALEEATRKRARGTEAPGVAVALVRTALTTPFAEGAASEREAFLRLRASDQAAALRHIFLAERAAAKAPADVADGQARAIARVGVVGAGTMGTGIAMSVAEAGLPVTIVELSAEAVERGLGLIRDGYAGSVERGRLEAARAAAHRDRISGSTDYADLADCDLIIEAAFESLDVKHDIFARLAAVAKPGALLASNTSYLDLDAIAERSGRAADVVGMHYFSPANVMRLLEVVRGRHTAPDVLLTALAFAKRTKKVPVVAGVCNGFIGNRMLKAYVREAGLLVAEGASPAQVDEALVRFGMAMGPFAVADLSGIDIGYKARQAMAPGSYEPLAVALHDALVETGHLGRKTGSGFYVYGRGEGKSRNPILAPMIDRVRDAAGIVPRAVSDAEIVDRCMFALANEGGFILEEGIAARPGDIDVVYVNGYGFPRHRGGPMFYAAQRGLDDVRREMARFAEGRFGKWWAPSAFIAGRQLDTSAAG